MTGELIQNTDYYWGYQMTETFNKYADVALRLLMLIAENQDDSQIGNKLREQAVHLQSLLKPPERDISDILMGDLYMLIDEDMYEKIQQDEYDMLQQYIQDNVQKGNWIEVLIALKKDCGISRDKIAYLRGRAWQTLGITEISIRFFDIASRLDPTNPTYPYLLIDSLCNAKKYSEVYSQIARLENKKDLHARVRILCALMYFRRAKKTENTAERITHLEHAIILANKGLEERRSNLAENILSIISLAYFIIAVSSENIGRYEDASNAYDSILSFDPFDTKTLVAKGILLLNTDQIVAYECFELAARFGSHERWPYAFLSHKYLLNGNFEHSIEYGKKALIYFGNKKDILLAQVYEWLGISYVLIGKIDKAEECFEKVIKLPFQGKYFKKNYDIFKQHKENLTLDSFFSKEDNETLSQCNIFEERFEEMRIPSFA